MSSAKSLQSECTAFSTSKPKLKFQKRFVDLLTFVPLQPPIPTFAPLPPSGSGWVGVGGGVSLVGIHLIEGGWD